MSRRRGQVMGRPARVACMAIVLSGLALPQVAVAAAAAPATATDRTARPSAPAGAPPSAPVVAATPGTAPAFPAGSPVGPAAGTAVGPWSVDEALWDRPRTAASVRADPGVQAAVRAWLATPGARLAIRHGSGQNGPARAVELRQWLVALGVDPSAIVAQPLERSGSVVDLALFAATR
jgi:hypothetical protein